MSLWFDHCYGFSTFSHSRQQIMAHRISLLLFCFLVYGLSIGCEADEKTEPRKTITLAERVAEHNGHFRGMSIGMPMDSVLTRDNDYLFRKTPRELNYSIPFSPVDSTYFDVAYVFEHKKLYEIHVDVFLADQRDIDSLFVDFTQLLTRRYGQGSEKTNYAFWIQEENGSEIEITLRNVSAEFKRPLLSLTIIKPQIFVH
jgi:hypothetical protein